MLLRGFMIFRWCFAVWWWLRWRSWVVERLLGAIHLFGHCGSLSEVLCSGSCSLVMGDWAGGLI